MTQALARRQSRIRTLAAGQNPFTSPVLAQLRREFSLQSQISPAKMTLVTSKI